MKSTASKRKVSSPEPRSPLSVDLPAALRARLSREARRRKLKLATTARALMDERIAEIEDRALESRAERWQMEQAWATWDKIQAGDTRDVPLEELQRETMLAIERMRSKAQKAKKAS